MRIDCIHGYFKFTETSPGQISEFMSRYDVEIERSGDHFTFADLVDAPSHSIAGGLFLGAPTLATYAGPPWEVMRENRLVYNPALGIVMPLDLVLSFADLEASGNFFVASGILLPGSVMEDGKRVRDYAAFYLADRSLFRYSEVGGEY